MANPQTENGHTDIANEIVEALARTQLSSYENQVLFAIFRKTYGWHKIEDWISYSQLNKLTGIAIPHISRTIKLLKNKNIVTKGGNLLKFNKNYDSWVKLPKGVNTHHLPKGDIKLPKGVTIVTKGGNKKLPKGADTKETTKETLTKEKAITSPDNRNKDLQDLIDFAKEKQFALQGSQAEQRRYAYNLIRKKEIGLAKAKWLVVAACACRGKPYAPTINDFKQLFYKWTDLLSYVQKDKPKGVAI